jgi:hypothetical protein
MVILGSGRGEGCLMNRRQCLVAVAMIIAGGGAALAQSHPPRIIDCHVHYNGDRGFLEMLVAKLESIDGMAFLLTSPADLEAVKQSVGAHQNRLVGFGTIDLDAPNAVELVDRFQAAGFRGLGEMENPRKDYNDPAYWPIYERAQKYGMLILFHTGISARNDPTVPADVSVERQRVTSLDGIARHFPGLTLIGAHMGNPEYAFAAEVGRWNPNVYFDVSGSTLIKLQNNYGFFKTVFWWTGIQSLHTPKSGGSAYEKLVFGSDVFDGDLPEFDRSLDRYRRMLNECAVPAQSQENIFGGTLWRILHRQP